MVFSRISNKNKLNDENQKKKRGGVRDGDDGGKSWVYNCNGK